MANTSNSEEKEANKTIAEAYAHRIWNEKDLDAINELVDQKCIIHSMLGDFQGCDSLKKVVQAWLSGFPDLAVKNTAVICEKDLVVIHWQARGTHRGEFKGIKPAGKPVSYAGVTIYRISQSKIIEYWSYLDMKHLLEQIS
jgi:steroid delta-isomerase-like uncharacterized protein